MLALLKRYSTHLKITSKGVIFLHFYRQGIVSPYTHSEK